MLFFCQVKLLFLIIMNSSITCPSSSEWQELIQWVLTEMEKMR